MVFFSCLSAPSRAHCPIQGPQALAKTLPPISSKVFKKPSLSTVNLTCSEPGVMVYSALTSRFLSLACLATEAALAISSYDELVQEPIKPTSIFVGQPFFSAISFILEIGV